MSIIKIQEAGESHAMQVKNAEAVEGNFGQQAKFDGFDGSTIFLPLESAVRQLDRCGFVDGNGGVSWEEIEGQDLIFSRTANKSRPGAKPFWNIELGTKADTAGAKPSKRLPEPMPTSQDPNAPLAGEDDAAGQSEANTIAEDAALIRQQKREAVFEAYRDAWMASHATQGKHGTPESIQAGAATIMIQLEKRGAI